MAVPVKLEAAINAWVDEYMPMLTAVSELASENPGSREPLRLVWQENQAAYRAMEMTSDELLELLRAAIPA